MSLETAQKNNLDWFLPAIDCPGGVSESLLKVQSQLQERAAFVSALHQNLCRQKSQADKVTELAREAKDFENSLRFRLGILRPEREGGWFRPFAQKTAGPLSTKVLSVPVFNQYEAREVDRIRDLLLQAFANKTAPTALSVPMSESLWSVLLDLRWRLEAIVCLPAPFETLRLDTLPDGIPEELDCWSMTAFLRNVRREIQTVTSKIEECYQTLLQASERLWEHQRHRIRLEDLQRAAEARRQENQRSDTKSGHGMPGFKLPSDIDALAFMGFDDWPDRGDLRRRYLTLAKKYHPDRLGGDETEFKRLNRSYRHLEKRVETPVKS